MEQNINFEEFSNLLYKDSKLILNHEKWNKNLTSGEIKISENNYTLKTTLGKRELIFDKTNKLVDTKPLYLDNDKVLN